MARASNDDFFLHVTSSSSPSMARGTYEIVALPENWFSESGSRYYMRHGVWIRTDVSNCFPNSHKKLPYKYNLSIVFAKPSNAWK